MDSFYDIIIVGGGPVGLFSATYARMHLAKVKLIESLSQLGGQVSALFPVKDIYDIPGFPAIKGGNFITYLQQQAGNYHPEINLNETVKMISKINGGYQVETSKASYQTKSIIIATGAGAFAPRKLRVSNAPSLENKRLFYAVHNPQMFANQKILIAGGGDSAVDWALDLSKIAADVTLIHRRDQFRALESSVAKLKKTPVHLLTPFVIKDLEMEGSKVKVTLKKSRSKENKTVIADSIIVNYGFMADNSLIHSWGLETEKRGIKVDRQMMTNLPNIFAIGDAASYEGRTDLIATGFGEVPVAVNTALTNIYPDKRQPLHSTQLVSAFKKKNKTREDQ